MAEIKPLSMEEFEKLLDRDLDELFKILHKQDDLVPMLLRFHFLTENVLERIIVARLPRGQSFLDHATPTYHQKLELVNALDVLKAHTLGALRKVNKLRNASAHTADLNITKSEIEEMGRPLGAKFIQIRREHSDDLANFLLATLGSIWSGLAAVLYRTELADAIPAAGLPAQPAVPKAG